MTVLLTTQAHRDIASIKSYIAQNSPSTAERIAKKLYDEAARLIDSPLKGVELSAKFGIQTDLRMWIVSPNLILYKILEERVIVTRIMDERTNYLSALKLTEE